jgi:glycosyltransferase involved in cell wall biosynthesis
LSQQGRKILFISLTRTGSTAYASALADAISHIEPIIITSHDAKKEFSHVDKTIDTYNSKFSFFLKSIPFFIKASALLKEYDDKEKICLYMPVFHPWNLFLAMWAGVYGIPVISTIHDYHTHAGEKSRTTEIIQKLQIMISDKIVFLSEHQRLQALQEYPNKSLQFTILPHPIIASGTSHNLKHNSKMKFLFLGRVKTYKGYKLVIESANNSDIHHITIAGSGDAITEYNSNITYIDRHLSNKEISELLSVHHVLLLPYLDTSQSGVITLGIDAGMPMIISQLPGLEEQLDNDCGIWIEPTVDQLSSAMIDIQSNNKLYNRIKEKIKVYKNIYLSNFKDDLDQLLSEIHRL